jgi:D-alanyl-D-alanine carboxypeptidase
VQESVNHSKQSQESSHFASDDIPEALREAPKAIESKTSFPKHRLSWGGVGLGAIALSASFFVWRQQPDVVPLPVTPSQPAVTATPGLQESTALLGHLPYAEAPAETLQPIVADNSILLRRAAAEKFIEMVQAARADGVILVPISGFRSLDQQEHLFFDLKAQQGHNAAERAAVSAPPGYSEHHTGYAIDLTDGTRPDTNLEVTFESTPTFRWLQQHAAHFSFELSFPKDNPQGVSYEPWHWRFVGDRHSLETFYKARTFARPAPSATP